MRREPELPLVRRPERGILPARILSILGIRFLLVIVGLAIVAASMPCDAMPAPVATLSEPAGIHSESAKTASATSVEFDIETLKERGLDPALAQYFAEKPRFVGGVHRVSVSVNGQPCGTVDVRFDEHGNVCFDRTLIARARLRLPDELTPPRRRSLLAFLSGQQPLLAESETSDTRKSSADEAESHGGDAARAAADGTRRVAVFERSPAQPFAASCYDYRSFQPQTEVNADSAKDMVEIVVPADALTRPRPGDNATSGGAGAMLNYNVVAGGSRSSGSSTATFLSADTEAGFNVGDWVVRSAQTYWRQQGQSEFQMPYVFAQKTDVETGYLVQAGQIGIRNPVVSGMPIEGVQMMPDDALAAIDSGSTIRGVAMQQSRVEVRQAGILIYTTLVPAGPFLLRNVTLIDRSSLIEVTLIDDANNKRSFTVPPSSLVAPRGAPLGLSLALGRVYQYRGPRDMARPVVLSVAKGWNVGAQSSVVAGALVSSRHQTAGINHTMPLFRNSVSLGNNVQISRSPSIGERGASVGVSLSAQLQGNISINVQGNRQSIGFRTLSDTLYDLPDTVRRSQYWDIMRNYRIRDVMSGSASWNGNRFGALSASFNRFSTYAGFSGQHVAASWNRQFGRASLSINVDRSLGRGMTGDDTAIYASLSFPLGPIHTSTYVTRNGGMLRGGVNASQTVNDFLSYNIGVERGQESGSERGFATLSWWPRYTQVSISGSAQRDSGSLSAQVQGGVVATKAGVTLSPYSIGETFGIVSTGNLSGVSVSTPAGIVWTDPRGKAVIGSIPAYTDVSTVLRTETLPRDVDVRNGYMELNAGRGSVNFLDIEVRRTRRMLLNVHLADGSPLPVGSSIRDAKDDYVTTAVGDGVVYLDRESAGQLVARLPDGGRCSLRFQVPDTLRAGATVAQIDATCDADPHPM
ncbi:fimbria/pilus outer membrane usher protein [Burkholderia multivorans]|nr:fimbria/pilus outer membrane usher protein [Burkholderia multivorans]MBR8107622.1 fimbria/pilus outer membrane usher protein [Burkholderia multivorans]MBR8336540.1 fimbria/pilus outer membrane usher protein [Burkholderia multivorans]MBU9459792.1 fimbria/pilus outer membrane usher protein [Burkholderia multivorans]MBU9567449.1 fimbria/pilus outer membrane usher protein [Burkholderia multivorans]